jgi:hypothetical protein
MNITRTVLLGLVPFAALIFFNIKIYQRFIQTRRRYQRSNNNSSQVKPACNKTENHFSPYPRSRINLYTRLKIAITCVMWTGIFFPSRESLTHSQANQATSAARVFSFLLIAALRGKLKTKLLAESFSFRIRAYCVVLLLWMTACNLQLEGRAGVFGYPKQSATVSEGSVLKWRARSRRHAEGNYAVFLCRRRTHLGRRMCQFFRWRQKSDRFIT